MTHDHIFRNQSSGCPNSIFPVGSDRSNEHNAIFDSFSDIHRLPCLPFILFARWCCFFSCCIQNHHLLLIVSQAKLALLRTRRAKFVAPASILLRQGSATVRYAPQVNICMMMRPLHRCMIACTIVRLQCTPQDSIRAA